MLTPAQKHWQTVMANRRGAQVEEVQVVRTAHEQILHRLRMDQASLHRVQSAVAKAGMKREMLPGYQGWIDGTLQGDSGRPDEVITTLMIWAVDCQDYPLALRIGRYVVRHGLAMRDDFKRTAPVMLAEEMCNQVINLATTDTGDLAGYIPLLDELADVVAGCDMPDEVAAKIYKSRAYARRNSTDPAVRAEMLEFFRQATALNPNAGVKREIQSLTRELKNAKASASEVAPAAKKADVKPASKRKAPVRGKRKKDS